jgi:hypothetical protein
MGQRSDLFDFPDVLERVQSKHVNARVREFFEPSKSACSVLLPMG